MGGWESGRKRIAGLVRVICNAQLSSSREHESRYVVSIRREGKWAGVLVEGVVVWWLRRVVTSKPPSSHRHCHKRPTGLLAGFCASAFHMQVTVESIPLGCVHMQLHASIDSRMHSLHLLLRVFTAPATSRIDPTSPCRCCGPSSLPHLLAPSFAHQPAGRRLSTRDHLVTRGNHWHPQSHTPPLTRHLHFVCRH